MVAYVLSMCISIHCIPPESMDMLAYHELSAPPGSDIHLDCNPISLMSLRRVAVRMQLHCPSDIRFDSDSEFPSNESLFSKPEEVLTDINIVRYRLLQCRDCPRTESLRRFNRQEVLHGLAVNRAYQEHLRRRMEFEHDRRDILRAALIEVQEISQVYDKLDDAFRSLSIVYTRQALRDVRRMIGQEAFERGQLPFCLPRWQFVEGK